MAQWGNQDQASDAPNYANNLLNVVGSSEALFGNTTADAFVTDLEVGTFGVSEAEMADTNGEADAVTHAGWVLRKEGTGGRAGRVQYETLVAMSSISGDADDDTVLPE